MDVLAPVRRFPRVLTLTVVAVGILADLAHAIRFSGQAPGIAGSPTVASLKRANLAA